MNCDVKIRFYRKYIQVRLYTCTPIAINKVDKIQIKSGNLNNQRSFTKFKWIIKIKLKLNVNVNIRADYLNCET